MTRESRPLGTWNAMRAGMFVLITPVTTSRRGVLLGALGSVLGAACGGADAKKKKTQTPPEPSP